MKKSFEEHFWSKVDKRGPEECWPWRGKPRANGYGAITWGEQYLLAHRVAYELTFGPPKFFVLHKCDNRLCCNPSHLFDDTPAANTFDRIKKGRKGGGNKPGDASGVNVLTREDVLEIRRLNRAGVTQLELAQRFHVVPSTIYNIVRRKTWKHV